MNPDDKSETTEDFILRVPCINGRSRDQLYTQIVLFLDASRHSAITGAPFSARWPKHPWGSPLDYILVKDQAL